MVDAAIDAMADFMRSGAQRQPRRRVRRRARDRRARRRRPARRSRALLGGEPRGVVFGPSMTALTMRFAGDGRARRSAPGDEVVCTRLDHDANVRPWLIAAERAGATVRFAEPEPGTLELPGRGGRGRALRRARAGSR